MDGYINCAIEEMGEMVPLSNWWIRLTDRMGNAQGIGAITMERNMMNTLRMDVDNVILGEARWPAITWLFIRLSMLTKRMVGTTFHTRVDVGRGVHHVLQRMILEATAGSQGVSTNANTASLLADNVRFIFALDNVNGSPRMTEVGYIEDYDAVTQEVTWCKVAYWDYFEKTWVFQGVPASFLLRANIKGIHLPFTVYEGPRETYRVPKEG
ncbi:CpaF/VirB11 family protein, partial [Sulfoacidibacillus ferrooxidans]|uniref:Uncharacterized protein n=1 Tax=Sulfoacidibacillus ferrooxidans TaxID=2005001 RepID=A0A9X1VC15_9BACL